MRKSKPNGERSSFAPKFSRLKKKLIELDYDRKGKKHPQPIVHAS